jgi:hypothetical protein
LQRADARCSEFNHRRDASGKCVLVEGAEPLASEPSCAWDQTFWHERTNMRKIPYSTCKGGLALDEGIQHLCPGQASRGGLFWLSIIVAPFAIAALFACWWRRRRSGGRIRLGEGPATNGGPSLGASGSALADRSSGLVSTLASVPYWLLGIGGAAFARISRSFGGMGAYRRGGYRSLAVDGASRVRSLGRGHLRMAYR